jgi:hypothetical protein
MDWQGRRRMSEGEADWLVRAVFAGFIATALMTSVLAIAYGMAAVLGGTGPQAPVLSQWLWGLAHNPVTQQAQTAVPIAVLLHFVAGIAWAVVYAALAEGRLRGPGWRRGLLFAPLPWLFSLFVFLPALGGGVLGLGLGAGPLPIIGNLLLHLVYGVTLGAIYPPESDQLLIEHGERANPVEVRTMAHAERTMATGMVIGLILGGLAAWVISLVVAPGQPGLLGMMLGMLLGSAAGALAGSYSGLPAD